MKPRFSISIVTFTALEFAKRCIQSVQDNSDDYELILTANGSPHAAWHFNHLATLFDNIKVVVNPSNEGFGKPHNHALTLAKGEYFVCLNDDVTVSRGWLEDLAGPLEKDPKGALSCPDGGCSALSPSFMGMHGPHEYCEGACLMSKAALVREHGLFSELPGLAYGEDSDLSLRMRELGYTLHWVRVAITHAHGATARNIPEVRLWMDLNHAYLREKWANYLKTRKFPAED